MYKSDLILQIAYNLKEMGKESRKKTLYSQDINAMNVS